MLIIKHFLFEAIFLSDKAKNVDIAKLHRDFLAKYDEKRVRLKSDLIINMNLYSMLQDLE